VLSQRLFVTAISAAVRSALTLRDVAVLTDRQERAPGLETYMVHYCLECVFYVPLLEWHTLRDLHGTLCRGRILRMVFRSTSVTLGTKECASSSTGLESSSIVVRQQSFSIFSSFTSVSSPTLSGSLTYIVQFGESTVIDPAHVRVSHYNNVDGIRLNSHFVLRQHMQDILQQRVCSSDPFIATHLRQRGVG
jgi:hypothetical protein